MKTALAIAILLFGTACKTTPQVTEVINVHVVPLTSVSDASWEPGEQKQCQTRPSAASLDKKLILLCGDAAPEWSVAESLKSNEYWRRVGDLTKEEMLRHAKSLSVRTTGKGHPFDDSTKETVTIWLCTKEPTTAVLDCK